MSDYDFNYHSGTGDTFIGPRPTTDLFPTPELVAAPQALRKIRFQTSRYAPNHVITIRTASEGWTNDTFGIYREGAWEFFFEIASLLPRLVFKFVLDGEHWMNGPDLSVPSDVDHSFDEGTITFPFTAPRFIHGYDNFHIDRTKLAQDGIPRNTREDIEYDVIIIGSGMGGGTLADALSREFLKNGGYDPAEKLLRKTKRLGPFQDEVVAKLTADLGDWHVEDLPRSLHQPFLNDAGQLDSIVQDSTGMFSTADLLVTSMGFSGTAGRQNLTINLGHLVTDIASEGRKATAVVCQDLLGNATRRYRGKFIVLAAGSMESPRIALNSELRDPSGKLGVGLTDHPAFFSAEYTIPNGNPFAGSKRHAKVFLHHKRATFDDHPFNVEAVVNPEHWHVRRSDDDLVPNLNASKFKMVFSFASLLDDGNRLSSRGVGKKLSVNVHRNRTGERHFNAARDARNAILASLGIPFTADGGMRYGNEGTVHHAGGTMRMSGNATGVVNTDLRFEAYDNLYCADPSVWPFIPAANPALSLVALSLRLADELKSKL